MRIERFKINLPNYPIPSGFPIKISDEFLISLMCLLVYFIRVRAALVGISNWPWTGEQLGLQIF
jgi:hypothetical protein